VAMLKQEYEFLDWRLHEGDFAGKRERERGILVRSCVDRICIDLGGGNVVEVAALNGRWGERMEGLEVYQLIDS
jgi:hypothetical protein